MRERRFALFGLFFLRLSVFSACAAYPAAHPLCVATNDPFDTPSRKSR
jgi:hypothetical protein